MFHMAFGQAFLWLTSHRTNNGPGLAFVLSAEAGERWLFKIPIPSLPFHRHQSVVTFAIYLCGSTPETCSKIL